MSVIVHGDGHLTIELMCEQAWPTPTRGGIEFIECCDLILRNHGIQPLGRLYVLSPHFVVSSGSEEYPVFTLMDEERTECFNWVFTDLAEGSAGANYTYKLSLPSASLRTLEFRVTHLKPVIDMPDLFLKEPRLGATFWATGMTMGVITFEGGAQIEPFDPMREEATTYWLRLAFRSRAEARAKAPFRLGGKISDTLLTLESYEFLGPDAVLDRLADQLNTLSSSAELSRWSTALWEEVLNGILWREGTSTRVEDHRVILVTDDRFLVFNMHQDGSCGSVGQDILRGTSDRVTRTWIAGAAYYPESDALELARMIWQYVREWAYNAAEAKTISQITLGVGATHHDNVHHIVQSLFTAGFLRMPQSPMGYYYVNTNTDARNCLLMSQEGSVGEFDSHQETKIRTLLYGAIPVEGTSHGSRFKPASYRIQFDLAIGTPRIEADGERSVAEMTKVFVVHGRNLGRKEEVARLIDALELEPVVLHEQPNKGRTIIEKFEDYSDVGFAVVLLTGDDVGKLKDSKEAYQARARQNVILELGYFLGRLGRDKVCAVYEQGVAIPTDYSGVLFVLLDDAGQWKYRLVKEMKAAGINVDANRVP